ncbi:hypothetical protein EI94DRAFT_1703955 [Lactarius quietus]|nr:hypothetical protein EI94DRAFT_1703955 [Lactarius quietus]
MATPQTSLPHPMGRTQMQTQYQPGTEDFGFDTPPLPAATAAVSPAEINTLPPHGSEDFGFDALPQASVSPPRINALPPRGSEDFGFDVPLLEHQSNTDCNMLRDNEVFGRDAELLTEEGCVEGTLLESEDTEMDGPVLSDIQGPSSELLKTHGWTWGQRAPAPREATIAAVSMHSNSGAHTEAGDSQLCLQHEYKVRASLLLAEAIRIQQLYSELWHVYDIDVELTDAVEKMTEECRLAK